jgi:hypothetical protein
MADQNHRFPARKLSTPRAAAIAGVLFGLLFGVALVFFRLGLRDAQLGVGGWVEQGEGQLRIGLALIPFAGIAYLWFVGVVRDRIGELEDRFFATLFFGSSLLFLAMVFISATIAGAVVALHAAGPSATPDAQTLNFARALMLQISNIYALRMAGLSMITLATIWLRTGSMPPAAGWVTYGLAGALLLVSTLNLWITLVYPGWVLSISLLFLIRHSPVPRAESDRRTG